MYFSGIGNDSSHKDENCFLCDPTWAQDVCVQRSMSLSCLLYQAVM